MESFYLRVCTTLSYKSINIYHEQTFILEPLSGPFASSTLSADNLRIEPTFWWSGMKNPELQLMVYGKDIAGYLPSVKYPGVQLKSSVALESPNYLLIYLDVENAKPGRFDITFTKDKKSFNYSYELKARKPNADRIKGFDSSDVLYLIMPDRFANGDPSNDQIPMRTSYKVDRNSPNARHGGDLAGYRAAFGLYRGSGRYRYLAEPGIGE